MTVQEAVVIASTNPAEPSANQQRRWFQFVCQLRGRPLPEFPLVWDAYQTIYRGHDRPPSQAIVWQPSAEAVPSTNISRYMAKMDHESYASLHRWSVTEPSCFWESVINELGIRFLTPPETILEMPDDPEQAHWLPGATLNIVDSCFKAPSDQTAIISGNESEQGLTATSYGQLKELVAQVASALHNLGFRPGDAIALYLPMTPQCVAAYLGIIKAGCQVISIADSFSSVELKKRLEIGRATGIITVDRMRRGDKVIELFNKVKECEAPRAVIISSPGSSPALRNGDLHWEEFLNHGDGNESWPGTPETTINILFSSGTTGTPKAIPWTQLTPIKAAMDGYFHQDIHPEDVIAWPTNIGWMMGPWLIFATLINGATMALFEGRPTTPDFLRFTREAKVSILGLVPALVRAWRTESSNLDLSAIRLFSSTGEASNPEDYLWLMSRTGFQAPVIEYCGGTEIGGGYITGTMIQPAAPSLFTTPALGIDFTILGDDQQPVEIGQMGEVFLKPPSIGLSQTLLNADHHQIYYADCPRSRNGRLLRRHGDQLRVLGNGFYRAEGRADDTMNLRGIKVSSIELESVLNRHPDIQEGAAVSLPSQQTGERLFFFAVAHPAIDPDLLKQSLNRLLADQVNPLFKIHQVVIVDELPRTASNKLMRRSLRNRLLEGKP